MVAALYAIAAAMIVGGSYIANVGYDIILVERGWSQVIAGSVLFTGGLLLLGIATIVWRLGKINSALLMLRAVPGAPLIADVPLVEQPVAQVTPPTKASSQSENSSSFTGHKDSFEPEQDTMSAFALEEARLERLAQEEAKAEELAAAEPSYSFEDEIAREVAARNAVTEPSSDPVVMDIEITETNIVASDQWEAAARSEPIEEVKIADEQNTQVTLLLDESEQEVLPEAEFAQEVLPEAEPEIPSVTVIGSYDSGGNKYVMYSDGSIDAHLPGGLHRFASLDELKQFIGNLQAP